MFTDLNLTGQLVQLFLRFLLGILPALATTWAVANESTTKGGLTSQGPGQNLVGGRFFNPVDEALTIRKVSILSVRDNLNGIYARPAQDQLTKLIRDRHRWDYIESSFTEPIQSIRSLETQPALVKKMTEASEADSFFALQIVKMPEHIDLKLSLFSRADGRVLLQEELQNHKRFEIADINRQVQGLFEKIVHKLPYQGLVMSRQANRVTLNLGKKDGIQEDQTLVIAQIVNVTRHPKFDFLINTEKQVLGRVKVMKVDDTLSFGAVVSEIDRGAIRRGHKVTGLETVEYSEKNPWITSENSELNIESRPDSNVSFGEKPQEWLPTRPPSFGAVGLQFGFGSFNSSLSLDTQTLESSSNLVPGASVFGELWLDPRWTVRAEMEQGLLSSKNPRSGSTPSDLNQQMSQYGLYVGYNVLLRDDFWGPRLQPRIGFMRRQTYVDASSPLSLTTTTYSGLSLGLHGRLPIDEKRDWYLGAGLNVLMFAKFNETPVSSGADPKSSGNVFSLLAERKLKENLFATGTLEFSLYRTTFSGPGGRAGETASSFSQRQSRLNAGIVYMF